MKLIQVTPQAFQDLEALRLKTNAATIKDLLGKAFATFDMIIDHQLNGGLVILRSSSAIEEDYILPTLCASPPTENPPTEK